MNVAKEKHHEISTGAFWTVFQTTRYDQNLSANRHPASDKSNLTHTTTCPLFLPQSITIADGFQDCVVVNRNMFRLICIAGVHQPTAQHPGI